MQTSRTRIEAEDAEYEAWHARILAQKNRYRQSLGLDPLPPAAPDRIGEWQPKRAPWLLKPESGKQLSLRRFRWGR